MNGLPDPSPKGLASGAEVWSILVQSGAVYVAVTLLIGASGSLSEYVVGRYPGIGGFVALAITQFVMFLRTLQTGLPNPTKNP